MRNFSDEELNEARSFLRRMLDVMRSMDYNLECLMEEAAKRIVDILYLAGIDPKTAKISNLPISDQFRVNEVLNWFKEAVYDCFEALAVLDEEKDKDVILPFVLARRFGKTFDERLSDYVGKFKTEMFILTLAELAVGVGSMPLVKSNAENFRHPYKNPLIADGIERPETYLLFFRVSDIWPRKLREAPELPDGQWQLT